MSVAGPLESSRASAVTPTAAEAADTRLRVVHVMHG